MTIDKNDNIYLTDSYDKIKATIGDNFVTDSYYKNDPAKKYAKYTANITASSGRSVRTEWLRLSRHPMGNIILPNDISGMTTDDRGNIIYAAYGFARFIGKIDLTTGSITQHRRANLIKENGVRFIRKATAARRSLSSPETIITSKKGEIIFTDQRLHRVIKSRQRQGINPGRQQYYRPLLDKTSAAEHRKVIKTAKH